MTDSARALLLALSASARPAGSDAEAESRRLCAEYLETRGFSCVERPFTYSTWPGRWATPMIGIILCVAAAIPLIFGVKHWIYRDETSLPASFSPDFHGIHYLDEHHIGLALLFVGIASVIGMLFVRYGTVSFPWFRDTATNLECVRIAGEPALDTRPTNSDKHPSPSLWLIAHLDSKSQPIPMALRVAAVMVSIIAWSGLLLLWLFDGSFLLTAFTATNPAILGALTIVLAFCALLAAIPLALCTVGQQGTGALDNASGVATVLSAVEKIDPQISLGVLLTSAEELGLAGARAWVRERQNELSPPVVLNCDSVDDAGILTCMIPRRFHDHFRDPLLQAQHTTKIFANSRRLIPGILVDAVPFTEVGWPALTVSRGNWRSLARIHSNADNLDHMTGAGVESAAQFMAALASAIVSTRRARG